MEMYAILQVIEERAVRDWPVIVDALRPVDPEASDDVAYSDFVTAFTRYVLERGLLDVSPLERAGWKALLWLEDLRGPRTRAPSPLSAAA
jgi:hypothetical protein